MTARCDFVKAAVNGVLRKKQLATESEKFSKGRVTYDDNGLYDDSAVTTCVKAVSRCEGHFVKSSAPRAADANMSAPHKKRLLHSFENLSKGHLEHEDGTYDGDVNERADGTRLAHGSGTRTFSDGSVFVGTFRDGVIL
jgi:hypothetical protein